MNRDELIRTLINKYHERSQKYLAQYRRAVRRGSSDPEPLLAFHVAYMRVSIELESVFDD